MNRVRMCDCLQSFSRIQPRTPEEIAEYEWKTFVLKMLTAAKLPSRFHQLMDDWGLEQQADVFEKCCELLQGNGAIVALVGPRGTGKTTIAAQLIIRKAFEGCVSPYRKLSDLLAAFKSLYSDYGSFNQELVEQKRERFVSRQLVVIDEVHECGASRIKDDLLTDVIDRRYSERTDTVLISNQTANSFQQTIGDSVLSRLAEHGAIIACEWPSWRSPRSGSEAHPI